MTLKRRLLVTYLNLFHFLFLRRKFHATYHSNCSIARLPQGSIDIITIAFNNEFLIEQQIRLIKKYITDENYSLIVMDNSTNVEKQKLIQNICEQNGTGYVLLPRNPMYKYWKAGSYAHGFAMNWAYYNFIRFRQPKFFGFIDHDMFPISSYSITEKFNNAPEQCFYGTLRDIENKWYLWAGMCFYWFEKVKSFKINFIPCMCNGTYLDTGGNNYKNLYAKFNKSKLSFCKPAVEKTIRDGGTYHNDTIQYIDDVWIHAINGSNWTKGLAKDDIIEEILSQF